MASLIARLIKPLVDSPFCAAKSAIFSFFPFGTRITIRSTFSASYFLIALSTAAVRFIKRFPSFFTSILSVNKKKSRKFYTGTYLLLTYGTVCDIMTLQNKKDGSTEERQLLCACAGGYSTYTTDYVRTDGDIISCFARQGKRILLRTGATLSNFLTPCRVQTCTVSFNLFGKGGSNPYFGYVCRHTFIT